MRASAARLSLLCAVAFGGGVTWFAMRPTVSAVPPAAPAATTTVPSIRTTLEATQPVSGRIAVAHSWTIGLVSGSPAGEVAAAGDAVLAASEQLTVARAGLSGATRIRSLTLTADRAQIASAVGPAAVADARRHLDLDTAQQAVAVAQAQVALTAARRALDTAGGNLANREENEVAGGTIVTSIAAPGTEVERGGALYALDGHPTVLLVGSTPAYRAMRQGDRGVEVVQLQANLVALGFGGQPALRTDGVFDADTATAVRRWQTAGNLSATGVVRLGDVTFLPSAVVVAADRLAVGAAAEPGMALLDLSSVERIVTIALDPALAGVVHAGDALRLTLPDGTDATGHVQTVAAIATPTSDGQSAGASSGGGGQGGAGQGGGPLFIAVTATADDPAKLDGLDGAPVTVDVTTATARDVLAVPVNALLVLADGSYGVELRSNGASSYVRVETGVYDRTLVEVRGDGLAPGQIVVVPAS
jgi:membrane fusion protein, multidrug efflux system